MAKVKVIQRSVYHKYAEIEVEVPDGLSDEYKDETSESVSYTHLTLPTNREV